MRARSAVSFVAGSLMVLAACGGGDDNAERETSLATSSAESAESSVSPTLAPDTAPAPTAATSEPDTAEPVTAEPVATVDATAADTTISTDAAVDKWQSPDGVFAVAFPDEPAVQQLDAPLDDGTSIPVTAYLAEVGGAAVIASCVDYPDGSEIDVDAALDGARDGALGNVGATLVDSERIELQGRPGIEFRGTIGEAGGVLARSFLDGVQLCQVLVVGEPAVVEQTAPNFLDSFEFLQEAT